MYPLQSRNTAKVNAKPITTAVYIKPKPPVGMGFANAAKATIMYQKTRPCVNVKTNNKHDQWFMNTQSQQDERRSPERVRAST